MSKKPKPAPVRKIEPFRHEDPVENQVRVKIADIRKNPRNFRTHPPAQVEAMIAAMDEFGVTSIVIVDEENLLLAGEGRILSLEKKGRKDVLAARAVGWSDEKKRRFMAADNRLFELGGYDQAAMRRELGELRAMMTTETPVQFMAIGFSDASALDTLLAEPVAPEQFPEYGENIATDYECPHCHHKWSGKPRPDADGDRPRGSTPKKK